MFSSSSCMYWLVSYRWIYTLFSSKLLLSLWPLVSATILGVTIVTLGMTPVVSGACMLMYGPACPCMCLQASVHSCSAGHASFFWNYIPQSIDETHSHNHPSKVSYQLQLCNCQLTLCVHPSKHVPGISVSVCVCMRLWNVSACICT